MEVSITLPQEPNVKHSLQILKKVSQGKFSVYHAYSPAHRAEYALKLFPKDEVGLRQYTKETIMFSFSHPNIIKHIPATVGSGKNTHCYSILTEFAKYGEVFDLVIGRVFNTEILVRTYFHQLVAGLEYIHSQGVAHLDLKLENLMIGSGFTMKIIDFDQAQRLKDKKITSGGTEGSRAPEVIDGSCTNFQAADIYSLGVILYALKSSTAPFLEETTQNKNGDISTSLKYYSMFIKNNDAFWLIKSQQLRNAKFFSREFKELINGMLQFDVSKRFTLEEIKNSEWFKGPVLTAEQLKTEMTAQWKAYKSK